MFAVDCFNLVVFAVDCSDLVAFAVDCSDLVAFAVDCSDLVAFAVDYAVPRAVSLLFFHLIYFSDLYLTTDESF